MNWGSLSLGQPALTSTEAVFTIESLVGRSACSVWGRNGFDGDTGLKMRVEDQDLVKNVELNLTADQELALAA